MRCRLLPRDGTLVLAKFPLATQELRRVDEGAPGKTQRRDDVVHELVSYGVHVHVHDPVADPDEARHEYGVELQPWHALPRAHAVVE